MVCSTLWWIFFYFMFRLFFCFEGYGDFFLAFLIRLFFSSQFFLINQKKILFFSFFLTALYVVVVGRWQTFHFFKFFLMNSVVCSSSRVRGISKWFCVDYFSSRFIFLFWCGHALKNFVKLKFQKILRALPFEFYRINNSH